MAKKTLKDLRVVTENWRFARVDRDSGGAAFFRIAAFAIETSEDPTEDDSVVALVSDPQTCADSLVVFSTTDADNIGILEPDDEGTWANETAEQIICNARDEDRRREEKSLAPAVAGELTDGERELLQAMVAASCRATTFVPTKSPAMVKDLFSLVNHGVVAFDNKTTDRSARWYPSTLGFAVVTFLDATPGRS